MAEQFRVVVVKDEDMFVAQCLEVDISAQGNTVDEAVNRLKVVFNAEIEDARVSGSDIRDIGPAPETFHAMYVNDVVEKTVLAA